MIMAASYPTTTLTSMAFYPATTLTPSYIMMWVRRCRISFKFTRPEMAMGKVGERGWIDEMEGPEQFQ